MYDQSFMYKTGSNAKDCLIQYSGNMEHIWQLYSTMFTRLFHKSPDILFMSSYQEH